MLTALNQFTRDNIIADKIGVEGGYVNNPSDRGGPTNFGITQTTAQQYRSALSGQYGWDGTMQNLTKSMAVYIYIQEYWNKMNCDAICAVSSVAPVLADLLFEAGINFGWKLVATWLQQALNVANNQQAYYNDLTVDGNFGNVSVAALAALVTKRPNDGLANLLWMVSARAGSRYIDICLANPSQETFLAGWQNRARTEYDSFVRVGAA